MVFIYNKNGKQGIDKGHDSLIKWYFRLYQNRNFKNHSYYAAKLKLLTF